MKAKKDVTFISIFQELEKKVKRQSPEMYKLLDKYYKKKGGKNEKAEKS